ncbi:hypothetical protein HA461_13780 [Rhizobium leguminosarum bv. trifolii]|uniref:hypothetical protein n=1 Tax=Rhizobium leguminosarum TaxID=384 RepID=UPI00140FBC32|nr:hypothetical protein [Rhizobium leguminosarum]QIO52176.1 hypothetical protein HA461_13780 [Rhizobium leguminosarum bv. trifolii]
MFNLVLPFNDADWQVQPGCIHMATFEQSRLRFNGDLPVIIIRERAVKLPFQFRLQRLHRHSI